ncbi:hypothetical protein N7541_002041 [Penicillium brevicompactum]|uniref:Uncharacterized protein n=1 Tax=Penicillium brevicompactum TaxID=5074 RepID=A0A9W9UXM7_PENBR|nr:hypothetical protein N7541_002041 [Penicillium brevicompactum]
METSELEAGKISEQPPPPEPRQPGETQATDLPAMTEDKWERIEKSLKNSLFNAVYFYCWHAEVVSILRKFKLHRLVDSSIPRPTKDHLSFVSWQVCSMRISKWLGSSENEQPLGTTIKICLKDKDVTFADDWMREVKALIGDPYGYTSRRRACLALWDCRKSDFEDIEEFLWHIRRRYDVARKLKTGITPYQVAMMILEELRWIEGYEILIPFKERKLEIRGEAVVDMTEDDLDELCDEIMDFAGHTGETKSRFDAACPRRGR